MKTLATRVLASILVPLALTCALALPMAPKPAHAQFGIRLTDDLGGWWYRPGNFQLDGTIVQQGNVLLVVNNRGSLATARVLDGRRFVVVQAVTGWQVGLQAEVMDGGHTIRFSNGDTWQR